MLWLAVNLLSTLQTFRQSQVYLNSEDAVPTMRLLFNLRGFLSQRQENLVQFHEDLLADPDRQREFRQGLLLMAGLLLIELIIYVIITLSFEFWGALILGGLVIAIHLQWIFLLGVLALLTNNREWFILTYKKAQLIVKPTALIELVWLVYLVLYWLS
ncbi:MAG: hypothetical protein GX058_01250 [Firmicutes bacterium]|nr:hypothetical protein [Bacillota bacterium]